MNAWQIIALVLALIVVGSLLYVYVFKVDYRGDAGKLQFTFSEENQGRLDSVSINADQLSAANCSAGYACWVAVNGVVYDVTAYKKWQGGKHHGAQAGTDATAQFVASPHAAAKLKSLPVVGRLEQKR